MLVLCVCTELSAGPAGESGRGNGIQAGVLGGRMAITVLRAFIKRLLKLVHSHMHCTGSLLLLSAQEEGTRLSERMPGVSHENVVLLKATPSLWLPV